MRSKKITSFQKIHLNIYFNITQILVIRIKCGWLRTLPNWYLWREYFYYYIQLSWSTLDWCWYQTQLTIGGWQNFQLELVQVSHYYLPHFVSETNNTHETWAAWYCWYFLWWLLWLLTRKNSNNSVIPIHPLLWISIYSMICRVNWCLFCFQIFSLVSGLIVRFFVCHCQILRWSLDDLI